MKHKSHTRRSKRASLTNTVKVNVAQNYPWVVLHELAKDVASVSCLRADDAALLDQIIRDRDVAALSVLSDIWGLQCINPNEDNLNLGEIRGRRLLAGLLKNFLFEGEEDKRRSTALQKFKQAEERCRSFNHGGWRKLFSSENAIEVFTLARSWIHKLLGERPRWEELVPWARFGPGSTLETRGGPTSVFFKYSRWPYTVTSDCLRYARFFIETDERWMDALCESYRRREDVPPHQELDMRTFWSKVFKVVDGNRIDFVPKSSQTDRTIAIEPLMNLRIQLGVDGFIRKRLKRHDIDLDDQTKNQVLASVSSELRGSNYATLDLSAASDTISLKLCELLLPPDWYSFLLDLRSPGGTIPGHGKVRYEKLSSMGNGYTFAVESAVFAAVTQAVIRLRSGTVDFKSDLAVYGDDIIVREQHAREVVQSLQNFGFAVNRDKSFVYGNVKESCGADWYSGHLVRPVALTKIPKDVMGLFVDRNRLARILELYFGIEDSFVAKRIESWIPPFFQRFRGPLSDTDFSTYLHDPDRKKWGNYSAGRWRYLRLTIRPVKMKVNASHTFSFRKLMADLSGRPVTNPYEVQRISDAGNRFTVTFRYDNVIVGQTRRPAESFWQDQYQGSTTGKAFRESIAKSAMSSAPKLWHRWTMSLL